MDERPLDLSAVDPARDPARWRGVMDETLTRAGAVLLGRQHPLTLIAGWRRPLLAGAAASVLLLVPAELALERREARGEPVRALARASAAWAQEGGAPSGSELSRALLAGGGR